ncbi:LysE family translocator [Limnohabitans sp.]|uniref:LysE family translocator n=1 Tax=Limnohabitans sp. TaxID=1907725 RepID=UPI00286ECB5A|nr:LysE family translocator [Limnohabitans sp.]
MLISTQVFAFLLTAVLLTATPGPDNLMVLSVGMSRGKRAGMAFGLGCALGCLSHTALAVVGVSALVAASPVAFLLLKITGGVYLVGLGVQALRHAGGATIDADQASEVSLQRLFAKGLLANAINPKVVLFFLSFLPQFVDSSRDDVAWQLGLLGVLFTAQAAILFGLLGYFAGSVGSWLSRKPSVGLWLDRLAGCVFIGLGIRIMVAY